MNPLLNNQNQSLLSRFIDFQKSMQGRNPEQMIKEMLNSGQISQAEYQQAVEKAKELSQLLKLR